MRTFILCVERYTHFPPEIYRLLATYLYYKQHWPDVNIKQYNKVMKQLPYPVRSSAPCIIYQTGTDYLDTDGNHHFANNATEWRCCKFYYDIPLRQRAAVHGRLVPWRPSIRITEYLPFCQCRYVNGVNEADFTVLFNTEVSTGTWELEFDADMVELEWMTPEQRAACWLTKVADRIAQEYKDREEYFKNPNVKQIKNFNCEENS